MSQVSIPYVVLHPLVPQPTTVPPSILGGSPLIPPELYIDDEHHGLIYCPDCGVMCSRRPRKLAKSKGDVDAFYFHMPGFDEVDCPHRKKNGGAGGDEEDKEKRAINLVTFAGWKSLSDDEDDSDEDGDKDQVKKKRQVQGGSSGNGNGFENFYDPEGGLLNPGEFRTVRRLVQLAQISLDIAVQFDEQEPVRLHDLIVSIEKAQKNIARYLGRSFLFFGQPTGIEKGRYDRVFFNFKSPGHQLSGHCEQTIFEKRNWKTFERKRSINLIYK